MLVKDKNTPSKKNFGRPTINPDMKDRGNDPFVLKKLQEAIEFIERVGFKGIPELENKEIKLIR